MLSSIFYAKLKYVSLIEVLYPPISVTGCRAKHSIQVRLSSYLDRTHLCCSPVSFPSHPHKVYHHAPRVGWCMNGNVFLFLHHRSHYIPSNFPKLSSLRSLKKIRGRNNVDQRVADLDAKKVCRY